MTPCRTCGALTGDGRITECSGCELKRLREEVKK